MRDLNRSSQQKTSKLENSKTPTTSVSPNLSDHYQDEKQKLYQKLIEATSNSNNGTETPKAAIDQFLTNV